MNKTELIYELAYQLPIYTRDDIKDCVAIILNEIQLELKRNGKVAIRNFGTFYVKVNPPRIKIDPRNGQYVEKGITYKPFFKCSSELNIKMTNFFNMAE